MTSIQAKINFRCPLSNGVPKISDRATKRKLIIGCVFTAIFTICQITGGIFSNSLAIMTDSAHIFSDLLSFGVSLAAIYMADRKSTNRMNFGWQRAEVLGALFSVLLIWVVTGVLVYSAVNRIQHNKYDINSNIMLIMSAVGVMVNVILACILHPHSHSHSSHSHSHKNRKPLPCNGKSIDSGEDMNSNIANDSMVDMEHPLIENSDQNCINNSQDDIKIKKMHHKTISNPSSTSSSKTTNLNLRAAFIHAVGDILQSFGVLTASLLIYFKPTWKIADPICTFIFSVLVLFTTFSIIRDVLVILFETCPANLSLPQIVSSLHAIPGVTDVHNTKVWSLSSHTCACVSHLCVDSSINSSQNILREAKKILENTFQIPEVTIQIEDQNHPNE